MLDKEKLIKKLIEDKNISNYRISKETGISKSALSDLKRGINDYNKMTTLVANTLYNYAVKFYEEEA